MSKQNKSVLKALNILEELAESEGKLGLTEISSNLGYSKSTAYRILNTLKSRGYVSKQNGHYGIGSSTLRLKLSSHKTMQEELAELTRPYLVKLEKKTLSTSCFALRQGTKAIPIQIVNGSTKLVVNSNINEEIPLHAPSLGKVLLAFMGEEKRDKLIEQMELEPLTENTITKPDELKNELAEIKEKGYGVDKEEYAKGICCVGAPVKKKGSMEPIGSVSVSTPTLSHGPNEIEKLKDHVVDIAREISENLGL